MTLKLRIENDFKEAMKQRDEVRLSCLRMLKAAIKNKEIDVRQMLDDAAVTQTISTMIKQRNESIEQFRLGKRQDLVAKEEKEVSVLQAYLPQQLSAGELEQLVASAVRESGATSPKQMGLVMKVLMPKIAGRADGKAVNALVQKKLSGA